ncbi:LacI family DNA-binding transcriptional regulator [Cohaesibacter sp. ES.047]|uniref:LacI family DNA-binding transcriptional regulator n=1 Tax=Cohaesibacter sp. ES.047 TaxID=1798205 RepID=UPI000BB781A7|nr:LacI family DNA-binding transcriptional regulator [Cohaesibacter sp. ES.047]
MEHIGKKSATIEDVAKLAGVSIATVSRAIRTPEKVAESTRKKVNAAIARTGYTANAMAQNLRMQRSQMVMILAESISDPNFPGILIGLEKAANERDYGVLIGNTEGNIALEEKYMRFLSTGMADGLLLLTGHLPVAGWPQSPASSYPPLVSAYHPVNREDLSYVGVDDVAAAKIATEYLISLGHKRIVYITGPAGSATSELRYKGYCDAMLEAYDKPEIWRIRADGTSEGGRAAVELLFIRDTLPTAFFCFNDDSAIGVISALQSRRFDVPKDFSVVGFDDVPIASHVTPSLTTIRQPRNRIGEMAMKHLLDNLPSRSIPTQTSLLHGDLIVRGSCGAPNPLKQ